MKFELKTDHKPAGVRSEYLELRKTLPDISEACAQKYRQGVQLL